MIFQTKMAKIRAYLNALPQKSPFDELLSDYMDQTLKNTLADFGITKIEIYVDCLDAIRCIGIQARYNEYYLNIEIDADEYAFAVALDEADEDERIKLATAEGFYGDIRDKLSKLRD